ncbi:MAG: M20 family metallopeptidase [Chloroflexi bacterium]|jgi:amidohydrolase|nr:M20 family metallopeptidase [Chloroflexota bacterium]
MELNEYQEKIIRSIDSMRDLLIDVSHQIHANPELSDQEYFATELLQNTLKNHGFEVEGGFAGIPTAFRARRGAGNGPIVAFLCEYDALAGIGHGCGHNVIGTTSLAAGLGLASVIDSFPGEVWVVGTPSEEVRGAKVEMVRQGVFKDVDAALMIHGSDSNYRKTIALAVTPMGIIFKGKPAHASATPWDGVNALDAMTLMIAGINALRQQIRPDARIHGFIQEGGVAPNIIPERTSGRFNVRALTRSYCDELEVKLRNIVKGASLMTGAEYEFYEYGCKYDSMINNTLLSDRVAEYAVDVLGEKPFQDAPESFGSIDMGNVSSQCPSIHMLIGLTDGVPMSLHTQEYRDAAASPYADNEIIRIGKALAMTGLDVIADADFRKAVREEFENARK